jgi:endonuclease/exonuclease/phosphatase family metal-dependent hydrolase
MLVAFRRMLMLSVVGIVLSTTLISSATAATPGLPTGAKVTTTSSTATISWGAAPGATSYAVCLQRTAGGSCVRLSQPTTSRTLTFRNLSPGPDTDYYFVIYSYNGTARSATTPQGFDLPALVVGAIGSISAELIGDTSIKVRWSAATDATAYQLQLATNSTMTSNLQTRTVDRTNAAPGGLTLGTRYYYRVRGSNGAVKGRFTSIRSIRVPSKPAQISVITYNLCGQDKCVTSANDMKRWSTRKAYAGRIARGTRADIISTQEAHEDSRFGTELPGFALASYYSAKSLYYKTSKYNRLRSGMMTLSSTYRKYAVWAELLDEATGNRFIVVDAHLQPYKGKTNDDLRAAQTKTLLSKVAAINPDKLLVVYAGDFNSNKSNAIQSRYPGGYDAPLKIFTAAGVPDTFVEATAPVGALWNSANQAKNPPLKYGDHVDHIFADGPIVVTDWRVIVSLDSKGWYAKPFATDHNPVRARLTIPGR